LYVQMNFQGDAFGLFFFSFVLCVNIFSSNKMCSLLSIYHQKSTINKTHKTLISYCINKCLVRIQCHGHEDNQLWRPDRVLPARSGAHARAAALCSCLCSSGEFSLAPG
jgi:hypothetical protein